MLKENPPRRVLLIEDDREMARSLATLLLGADCEVEIAFDGETGLETAESFEPHLCMVDLSVPRLNADDFTRRLRERLATPPLLANVTPFIHRDEWDCHAEFDLDFSKPSDPVHVATQVIDFLRSDIPKMRTDGHNVGQTRMPTFRR